ncbi:DciA family protein [Streptomyces sp. NPDC002120]|uniref:DciA family protein n=1 Tax=Streptomyces sp. NPDC002120 TaxID=3364631 RepID=UPI0036925AB2
MGLGAALGALVTQRAWTLPAAVASLCERWAAIAPELAEHVTAVGFDLESGRLTLCPESSAWATKARLERSGSSRSSTLRRVVRWCAPCGSCRHTRARSYRRRPARTSMGPVKARETLCEAPTARSPRTRRSWCRAG